MPDYVKRDFPEITQIRNDVYKRIMKEYGGSNFKRRVKKVLARIARSIRKKFVK